MTLTEVAAAAAGISAVGAVVDRERQAGGQAVAAGHPGRRAGQQLVRSADRRRAQPPGRAGDRTGEGPAHRRVQGPGHPGGPAGPAAADRGAGVAGRPAPGDGQDPGRAGGHPGAGQAGQRGTARPDAPAGQLLRRDRDGGGRSADGHQVRRAARSPGRWSTGWPRTSASGWCTPPTCPNPPGRSPIWRTGSSTCRSPTPASTIRARWPCRRSATSCWGMRCREDYSEFLEQRVEINYFAASLLIPERGALDPAAAGQGGQGHRDRGPARRLRGVLRDGRPPVHQPGHPAPGPAGALHADLVVGRDLQGVRERRRAFPDGCHRRDRGPAGVPVLDGAGGVRPARPVVGLPAVHRHRIRHLLVHRGCRPDAGRPVLGQRRGAVRGRQVDARPGDHGAVEVPLPGPGLLLAAARRTGRPLGGQRLAAAPGCTRTCWRRCRLGSSRASTRPTCSPSSSGTRRADVCRRRRV